MSSTVGLSLCYQSNAPSENLRRSLSSRSNSGLSCKHEVYRRKFAAFRKCVREVWDEHSRLLRRKIIYYVRCGALLYWLRSAPNHRDTIAHLLRRSQSSHHYIWTIFPSAVDTIIDFNFWAWYSCAGEYYCNPTA